MNGFWPLTEKRCFGHLADGERLYLLGVFGLAGPFSAGQAFRDLPFENRLVRDIQSDRQRAKANDFNGLFEGIFGAHA